MANTTSVNESPQSTVTIKIKIKSGAVTGVEGIPDGYYQCEILGCDVDEPVRREALYLATVNILVRATSPEHAVDVIYRVMTDQNVVDWDYAVQDRVRQHPRCVSLDLEPGNITELLDHIAT